MSSQGSYDDKPYEQNDHPLIPDDSPEPDDFESYRIDRGGNDLPSSYSELHGENRKGQNPRKEED